MSSRPASLEVLLNVCSALQDGPIPKASFSSVLSTYNMSLDQIEQMTGTLLIDVKENMVYLTDKGKEWFYHLGFLFGKRSLQALLTYHRQTRKPRLVNDACNFIMSFIEKLPKIESFWICSPWIVIGSEHRLRFKECLQKIHSVQIITRPPKKTASANLRDSIENSLAWLWKQGVRKISLHESVHAKAYLLEQSPDSWRNRVLLLGSENLTFSRNPELSLCIYDDRLFREAKARLASLITWRRFKIRN
jgi:hypothetical protein